MKRRLWMCGAVLLSMVLFVGCGRAGAPRPPEENAPRPVQYLSARGAVRAVTLSWHAPLETAAGGEVKGIESFVVQRRDVIGDDTSRFVDVGIVKVEPDVKLKEKQFVFEDPSVVAGRKYDYIVFARMADGLTGETDKALRVSFRGETSTIENLGTEELAQ